jgi:hypothetical protein
MLTHSVTGSKRGASFKIDFTWDCKLQYLRSEATTIGLLQETENLLKLSSISDVVYPGVLGLRCVFL